MRPLTERQEEILLTLLAAGELTPNRIAHRLGFEPAPSQGGIGAGRGGGAGTGAAQRVIGSLNGLRGRGLVGLVGGTGEYGLTRAGEEKARELRAAGGGVPLAPTRARRA